jgi:hypothetical protein
MNQVTPVHRDVPCHLPHDSHHFDMPTPFRLYLPTNHYDVSNPIEPHRNDNPSRDMPLRYDTPCHELSRNIPLRRPSPIETSRHDMPIRDAPIRANSVRHALLDQATTTGRAQIPPAAPI